MRTEASQRAQHLFLTCAFIPKHWHPQRHPDSYLSCRPIAGLAVCLLPLGAHASDPSSRCRPPPLHLALHTSSWSAPPCGGLARRPQGRVCCGVDAGRLEPSAYSRAFACSSCDAWTCRHRQRCLVVDSSACVCECSSSRALIERLPDSLTRQVAAATRHQDLGVQRTCEPGRF